MTTNHVGSSTESFAELAAAAQYYLDMLYACDPDMVDGIFHADAQLCTLEDGELTFRSVNDYKAVLRHRVPPSSVGAPRADELITIDLSAPEQGLIKVKMRINDLVFVDYLTMLKLKEGWRIVSKTYCRLSDG